MMLDERRSRTKWGGRAIAPSIALLACACVTLPAAACRGQDQHRQTAVLQVALDRAGFGVGLIDNRDGAKTRAALADYALARGLHPADARRELSGGRSPPFRFHVVDDALLREVGSAPDDWLEASQAAAMACESLDEALSERFHVRPLFLHELNPHVTDWSNVPVGVRLLVPNVLDERRRPSAASVQIDCAAFRLRALDSNGCILASFPCSIARDVSRVPAGSLFTAAFAADPVYVFDPANYPESARAQAIGRKLILPPGPNNPVGRYWIGLNQPGFGVHGTRHPETIGSRESHGCFRLTNWDILTLARMLRTGVPVQVLTAP